MTTFRASVLIDITRPDRCRSEGAAGRVGIIACIRNLSQDGLHLQLLRYVGAKKTLSHEVPKND